MRIGAVSKSPAHSNAPASLSTGAYAYPLQQAAHVALRTAAAYLRQHGQPELVRFVLFADRTYEAYAAMLAALLKENRCQ